MTALLKKGEALVWAANLAHGGSPVTDLSSTRRSLVTHYFFKGCLYHTPMTSDVEAGGYTLRLPHNLQTRGLEWPRGPDGRRAWVPLRTVARALRRPVTRQASRREQCCR